MKGLLLVGASGLAREALALLELTAPEAHVVIVDDDPHTWGSRAGGHTVVGGIDLVVEYPSHALLLCAGKGSSRAALEQRLLALGVGPGRYATLVHPDVRIPSTCTVGEGSIVLAGVVLTADVTLGRHVVLMPHVTLTHDDVIGDHATLCAATTLAGRVRVGARAYLGTGSLVREDVQIGDGAVLGMGSVALNDVPAEETWVGVPARPLTTRVGAR